MDTTYYLSFQVSPGAEGLVDMRIEGGLAHCWVVEDDPASATVKAIFLLRKSGWKIESQEDLPVVVSLENFQGRDLGEKAFLEAQEMGIATVIAAHTPAKELHTSTPVRQSRIAEIDLHGFLQEQQTIRSGGRCLFYQGTEKCGEIIDAHSIQKNGALSLIARDGYVYSVSTKFTDIKKNKGKLSFSKTHINSMSTFRGLCHHHDSLLFRPIDTAVLQPTPEQIFLYAYRSLLRERFAKECTVELLNTTLKSFEGTAATREMLEGVRDGNNLGLMNVKVQQEKFEEMHKEGRFEDIHFVVFYSPHMPTSVFSGVIFPDWGFDGEFLQRLGDPSVTLALMTFSFAPTDSGWAFLMAWHKEDDPVCLRFISTLQSAAKSGRAIEDLLFGLVVKGCENAAYSPDWFEQRSLSERKTLEDALTHGADAMKITSPSYLEAGVNSIHGWKFEDVQDNLPKHR